ncbi:hypothetical protein MNBD_GAMMA10-1699, partial [hydrothermal vent metagenome]
FPVDLLARLYGQHLYGQHFSGNFMLNRVSRYNKYSALLIKVILFSSLSYKILKLMNSASFANVSSIDSIKHAIIMPGRKQLISWTTMMALCSLDNRPSEMLHLSMVRAKTCEMLADFAKPGHKESYFTAGLFSAWSSHLPPLLKPCH